MVAFLEHDAAGEWVLCRVLPVPITRVKEFRRLAAFGEPAIFPGRLAAMTVGNPIPPIGIEDARESGAFLAVVIRRARSFHPEALQIAQERHLGDAKGCTRNGARGAAAGEEQREDRHRLAKVHGGIIPKATKQRTLSGSAA